MYSRMAKYYLIVDISGTFFQATVIRNKSEASNYPISSRTTCVALFRKFLLGYRSLVLRSLSVLVLCHREVSSYYQKNVFCISVYTLRIYLQSGGTGESLNVCWKLVILEIFLYWHRGQYWDPFSKCAQRRYITTSETPQTYCAIRATAIIYLNFLRKKCAHKYQFL